MSKNIITKFNNRTLSCGMFQQPAKDYSQEKKPSKERPGSVQEPKLIRRTETPATCPRFNLPQRNSRLIQGDSTTSLTTERIMKLHGVTIYPSKMEVIPAPLHRGLSTSAEWLKRLPEHKHTRHTLEFIKKRTEEDRERYRKNENPNAPTRSSFEEYLKLLRSREKKERPKVEVRKEKAPVVEPQKKTQNPKMTYIVDGVTRGFSSWRALVDPSENNEKPKAKRFLGLKRKKEVPRTPPVKKEKAKKKAQKEEPPSLRPIDLIVLNRKKQEELFRTHADHPFNKLKTNSFETPVLVGMAINKDRTRYDRRSQALDSFHAAFTS